MARDKEIVIVRDRQAIEKMLRDPELMAFLKKVGNQIADETEAGYKYNGRNYEYKAVVEQQSTRGVVVVGTGAEKAPYSELKHHKLLNAAKKKRS